ncbi:MAG: hypothetical protein IJU56_00750 [Clostridia bacterium]|nr:hypothetical protein [Clostridia bacterium]
MSKLKTILSVLLVLTMIVPTCTVAFAMPGTVCVTDYVAADTGKDVADALQAVIDANPNRTIYFPDGVYLLSHPLRTPADPAKSVDLQLTNYAVIRATSGFTGGALIALGGKDPYNTIKKVGSNYSLTGGVIDGNKVANGVSIDSGRETKVQNTSIKNTIVGLHIKYGANSGSSDADIRDINIFGAGTANSVGIKIEGHDNTVTNARIAGVRTGVIVHSNGNSLTNIHPLFNISWNQYKGSCGFVEESTNNLFTHCYSDQFQTAFKITGSGRSIYDNCTAFWWSGEGGNCTGFKVGNSNFNATVTNMRMDFRDDTDNTLYDGPTTGSGAFIRLLVNEDRLNANRTYRTFVDEGIIVHSLTYVPEQKATVEAEGTVAHYHCISCGKNYADENGTEELANITTEKLPQPEEPQPEEPHPEEPQPEEPQPFEPQEVEPQRGSCKYCGQTHDGLFGFFIQLFHDILALFGLHK